MTLTLVLLIPPWAPSDGPHHASRRRPTAASSQIETSLGFFR
jgi:hypothetical protein